MEDTQAISRRLAISNIAVFLAVLTVFGAFVYWFWINQIAEQERIAIARVTDAVIASIDFEHGNDGLPDLIATDMQENESRSLSSLRLQYFDATGKLLVERGSLKIAVPFLSKNSLSIQNSPHALVQTKSASYQGKLLGFVRVAAPLQDSDQMKQTLLNGLLIGLLIALAAAGLGTIWLVKLSLQPIQAYIQRLEKFTADAAHELRNPIAIVRTNSEVALKYRDNASKTDIQKFETILDAAMQMQKLTEDLLALARNQPKTDPSEHATHSIVEIVDEAITSVKSSQNDARITFDIKLPGNENASQKNLQVTGKRDEITRIIRNIAENAARYSKEGGNVDISIEGEAACVLVKMTDYGIGIESHDLPHIFDRFWRADQARNHHTGGNGLGLSIASTLARQNNGSIEVKSEISKGTTFTVKLNRKT